MTGHVSGSSTTDKVLRRQNAFFIQQETIQEAL